MLFLYVVSFLMWGWMFRGFLLGRLRIMGDAVSYYDHSRFFLDNLAQGAIPLWDPHWNYGVPNEFFLRRIGEFNPFYGLVVLFQKFGVTYYHAYFLFQYLYLVVGILGFVFLLSRLYDDRRVVFVGFLLFLFSTFGTMLFRSFVLLLFVPTVWFFAFLLDFNRRPSKGSFAGVIFTLMLIVTTYLPFFFLSIFLFFAVFQALLFPKQTRAFFGKLMNFCWQHKVFATVMVIVFCLALIPGLSLYLEGQDSDFAMPVRHHLSQSNNVFHVTAQSLVVGGILAHTVKDMLFANLAEIEVSRIYIPVFAYILFLFGLGIAVSRRMLLWFFIGLSAYMVGLHEASPVYHFLYQNVFIFRYFRNFQFYIWLIHVPVFVLICMELFAAWLQAFEAGGRRRHWASAMFVLSHLVLFLFLFFTQEAVVSSTYISLLISFVLIGAWIIRGAETGSFLLYALFMAIIVQPIEVYHYLDKNAQENKTFYLYDRMDGRFSFFREGERSVGQQEESVVENKIGKKDQLFYVSGWASYLRDHIDYAVYRRYGAYKFFLYDRIEPVSYSEIDFNRVEETLRDFKNIAFVYPEPKLKGFDLATVPAARAEAITGNSARFRVSRHGPNFVEIKTHFQQPKFLVYNDAYFKGWQVQVNQSYVPLFRANIAFKGVFIPAGESTVRFAFGKTTDVVGKILLAGLFWGVLITCLRAYWPMLQTKKIR